MTKRASVVLSVLPDLPIPPTTGLHVRMLSNLRVLQGLGVCSEVLYFTTEERRADPTGMVPYCEAAVLGRERRPYTDFSVIERVRQRAGFLVAAVMHAPARCYPFSVRYDAVGGEGLVVEHAQRCGADVVVLPGFLMHYAPALVAAGVVVIVDAIDVLSDLSWRFFTSEGKRRALRAPGLFVNWLACRSQERLFLRWSAEVWSSSSLEAQRLQIIEPSCNVLVVGSTFEESAVGAAPLPSGQRFGFIGTYTYSPNLDAVEHLATDVLPRVLDRCPQARLAIAGAGLPLATHRRLSSLPGVDILGRVPDSSDFIRSCSVLALPVFVRGGIPLKLVEAMACGRPVVVSPQLVAGLPVTDGHDLVVATGPERFAEGISGLLADASAAAKMGRAARATFDERFSLASVLAQVKANSLLRQLG